MIYVAAVSIDSGDNIHPSRKAQITSLKVDKAPTKVLRKYADFADVFLQKLVTELLEYMEINIYAIELVDNRQFPYGPIYSLSSMELETLNMYIKNNLAINFIRPSKSLAEACIFFDKKPNENL